MSKKLVGFGELLLRLDTPGHERISQAESYHARFTGGEANVCVAARRFGVTECAIVSQVPDHAIGDACLETLNRFGVDTSSVVRQGERLGILFVENGVSLRPSNVLYDRSHTSFRNADPEGFRWDQILTDAGVLHISGTAPALGAKVNRILEDAIEAAKSLGCPVSFDCSYRSALWGIEEAGKAFRRLGEQADILFATPEDGRMFFGVDSEDPRQVIAKLAEDYQVQQIGYTDREIESASVNSISGVLYRDGVFSLSRSHRFEIVDRIGSGDAFAAGILCGYLCDWEAQKTIDFASAAGALQHSIAGDFCLVSADEVERLVESSSLRIRR